MVDYSRWDNIDTGTDESSGDVAAPGGPGPRPPGAVRAMDPASIMASLPDEVLVLILANVDHASCHLTRATCGRFRDLNERACPVPLTVRGTQALVSFAPLAFKLFCAARQNAVLRRSPFPSP